MRVQPCGLPARESGRRLPRKPRGSKGYRLKKAPICYTWNTHAVMVMVLVSVLAELPVASVT